MANAVDAYALDHVEELRGTAVDLYRQRRDVMMDGFRSLGWTSQAPHATMFVWLPVPPAFDAQAWTEHLIDKAGVVVSPGNAFGPGGRGFFRVSLIADVDVLSAAIDRLRAAGIRYTPHA